MSGGLWLSVVTIPIDAQRAQTESPGEVFQDAVTLMEGRGDCRGASVLFAQVAEAEDRALASRALLYLGTCHERLGRADADRPYRRIVDEFGEQTAVAREARLRLARLARMRRSSASTIRLQRLWSAPPDDLVHFGSAARSGRVMAYVDRTASIALADMMSGQRVRSFAAPDVGHPGLKPVPSPDGTAVVYSVEVPNAGPELHYAARTGAPRRLFSAAPGESLLVHEWSRAAQLLLEVTHNDRRVTLGIVSVPDGTWRPLTNLEAPGTGASLSPDGRLIAYAAPGVGGRHDLWVIPTDGGPSTLLVAERSHDRHPMWHSANGVVFVSDRTGTDGLWEVEVNGQGRPGEQRVLVHDVGRVAAVMGLSDDGQFLYARQTGMIDVFLVPLTGGRRSIGSAVRVSTTYVGSNLMPTFSPDGRALAFVAQMGFGNREVVTVHDVVTNTSRQVTTEMIFLRAPNWSPDGRALLVKGNDAGMRFGFHRLDPQTGRVTALKLVRPQDESSLGLGRWSRDGQAIVFAAVGDSGRMVLSALNTATLRESPLLSLADGERLVTFALSPRDDTVAMVIADRQAGRIAIRGRSTADVPREILSFSPSARVVSVAWDAAGERLLVAQQTGSGRVAALRWVALDGTESEPLGIEAEGLRDLAASPDGRFIAYTAGYPTREPWMVEGFLPRDAPRLPR